jgi:RND family efflux transporter MFP subunit
MLLRRTFREGQNVLGPAQVWGLGWPGDVLFEIDPAVFEADLKKARADILRADADASNWKAQIKLAQAEFARAEESKAKGVGSQTDVDQKSASVEVAKAQLDVAKASREAAIAAEAKAIENLRYCTIYAPTTGLTGQVRVADRSIVTAYQTQLVEVDPIDPLYAVWEVDELTSLWYRDQIFETKEIPDPRNPQTPIRCRVTLKNGRTYPPPDQPGVPLDFIDPIVERQTGTRIVRATFPNPAKFLSAGDSLRVRVDAGRPRPVLVVPETAVFSQQQKQYVYVVGAEDKAELREVAPGPSFDGVAVIEKGLTTADRVIVDNILRVRPGVKVQIQK